jgi:hypothetical protein
MVTGSGARPPDLEHPEASEAVALRDDVDVVEIASRDHGRRRAPHEDAAGCPGGGVDLRRRFFLAGAQVAGIGDLMRLASSVTVALVVICLAGCGGNRLVASAPGEPPVDATTSPRIVPWHVGAAGAPLVLGAYDTQQRAHCRFVPDERGQIRCLPWPVGPLEDAGWFADATCGKRVVWADAKQAKALVGRPVAVPLPASGSCAPTRHAVATLREISQEAPRYAGTPCAPLDGVRGPDARTALAVETVVPPERWATGREVDGAVVGGRVRLRQIETADGARFDDHLVDERWGKTCALETGWGPVACWPPTLSDSTMEFTDDQCMSAPVSGGAWCEPPAFIGHNPANLHALGARWDGPVFERGKGCFAVAAAVSEAGADRAVGGYYQLGPSLGADAVAVVEWRLEGAGRFRRRGLSADGGAFLPLAEALTQSTGVAPFHDIVTEADCSPVWTVEGDVRCVPASALVDPYTEATFTDPGCSKPAYFCFASPCAGMPVVVMATDEHGERRAVSLRTAEVVSAVYTNRTGTCAPEDFDAKNMFSLGAERSWDELPALDETNGRASGAP